MNINHHGLRDHVQLALPLFGFIAAVWALRLILAAAAAPHDLVRSFSVTVAEPICVLLAVLLIHVRRFGSYANVVFVSFLLTGWGQVLIALAIAFAAVTGTRNIYTAPEYSFGELNPWQHVIGHLTFGVGIGTLLGAAMGSLLLWMLRQLPPTPVRR